MIASSKNGAHKQGEQRDDQEEIMKVLQKSTRVFIEEKRMCCCR